MNCGAGKRKPRTFKKAMILPLLMASQKSRDFSRSHTNDLLAEFLEYCFIPRMTPGAISFDCFTVSFSFVFHYETPRFCISKQYNRIAIG